MIQQKLHVVIAGAGLGGLCLAQALKKQGISFVVYERDNAADSRTQGYRIRIDETGQKALAACLSPELNHLFHQTCAIADSQGQFLDPQLSLIPGRPSETWQISATADTESTDAAIGDRSVNRLTLRQILLTGIEENVYFGKAVKGFEEGLDGTVTVLFADGGSVVADILVAADGINSSIRRQKLPFVNPEATGTACIYGKTYAASDSQIAKTLRDGTSVIFAEDFAVIIDAMSFNFPVSADGILTPVQDYLYWAVIGRCSSLGLNEENAQNLADSGLLTSVERISHTWAAGLRSLFKEADIGTVSALPIQNMANIGFWAPDRVTLLGDAIHAMSPAGGVGANTALADAAALAERLAAVGFMQSEVLEAIAGYEEEMRIRAREAITASIEGTRNLLHEGMPS